MFYDSRTPQGYNQIDTNEQTMLLPATRKFTTFQMCHPTHKLEED